MATQAKIGRTSAFAIGDGGSPEVFTDVAEVFSITPPNMSRDTVDATHMASIDGWREFITGLLDAGEASIGLNFVPGSGAQDALILALRAADPQNYRITYPNAEAWVFSGLCTGVSFDAPLADKMTCTARFKLTGKPAFLG